MASTQGDTLGTDPAVPSEIAHQGQSPVGDDTKGSDPFVSSFFLKILGKMFGGVGGNVYLCRR